MSGYKTYLAAAVGVVVAGLQAQGYIDEKVATIILQVAGFLGLAALRAGVAKAEK